LEVKRASTKVRRPFVAEEGSQRRKAPRKMTAAKPRMKIREGEKCREMKGFRLRRFFCGIDV